MPTLSGCTVVRNAVKLNYPLAASIHSYLPVCDEVVVAYDPTSEDGTEKLVQDLARRHPKIRPLQSPWDLANKQGGSEIAVQSNVAIEACRGDWVLYIQADEAVHEGDHEAIRKILDQKDAGAALFDRMSFLYSLDKEIPEYRAQGLLRLFRSGLGFAVGDAMSCALVQGAKGEVVNVGLRLFNYGRMGEREEVLGRARSLHGFYQDSPEAIEQDLAKEGSQRVWAFDPERHPEVIRKFYAVGAGSPRPVAAEATEHSAATSKGAVTAPLQAPPRSTTSPITLAVLLGPGETENVVPFLWQLQGWPGEIVLVDDMTSDGAADLFAWTAGRMLGLGEDRLRVVRHASKGVFSANRNVAHEESGGEWVFHLDMDERHDPDFLRNMPRLLAQLDRDGKTVCGIPRLNYIDGVLVNDVPSSEWTRAGLARAAGRVPWPPRNPDVIYRLLRRAERWERKIHELPPTVEAHPERVAVLNGAWTLHAKSLERQRRQDRFYRSMGQAEGMPLEETHEVSQMMDIRDLVLGEALRRIPPGRLTIVETGTLRDPNLQAKDGDGWSTLFLARLMAERGIAGSRLYSIDINPSYIEVARQIVPPELHVWVEWICADSRQALAGLDVDRIDLLYLDSANGPTLIRQEFEIAASKLAPHAVVVVDDTGEFADGPEGKGTLLIPDLKRRGWFVEHFRRGKERMTVMYR